MNKIEAETIFKTEDVGKDFLAKRTHDGFQNFALKLGIAPKGDECTSDNAISDGTYNFNLVTRNRVLLEGAYRGSWIVGRVVDSIAEDMTKAGVIITTNKGAEQLQELKVKMSRLQVWSSLCDAIKWGRLYGGAVAVMQIKGQKLDTPLNIKSVSKDQFQGLVVYDRWQLWPVLSSLIEEGPNMGLPAYYDVVLGANLNDPSKLPGGQETENQYGRVRIHHSRCVRLGGHKLPFFQAITEMMWDESVLERLWDRLIEFDTATAATGGLITRANLRTVRVDKLRNILASGGEAEEGLIKMFEYVRKFQSSEGLTILDKEDEFQSTAYSFAGLSDVLIQFGQQVSGSCEIPLVRLFGQSPVGLNSTGESDLRTYYDSVNAKQESQLRNPIEDILKVVWRSMTGQPAPDDMTFVFTPLWQMSATDKATIAAQNTASIISAHEEGLVDTPTAMKELKQSSGDTGLFTHITDEQIEEAESDMPPIPEAEASVEEPEPGKEKSDNGSTGDPGEGPATPLEKVKVQKEAKDSAWVKIKRWWAKDRKAPVNDPGVPGTMKEFYKGTLKSSSGKKVTSKKQALAIGYSEEGEDTAVTDAQKIRDWLRKQK